MIKTGAQKSVLPNKTSGFYLLKSKKLPIRSMGSFFNDLIQAKPLAYGIAARRPSQDESGLTEHGFFYSFKRRIFAPFM